MLSLNSLAKLSANVLSIFITKCIILDNLLYTTKITFFPTTNGNFVIKSTIRYIYSLFSTLNFPLVPLFNSLSFNTYYIHLHIFPYLLLFPVTSSFLSLTSLFSISLYILLSAHYSVTKLSLLLTLYSSVYTLCYNWCLTSNRWFTYR